MTIESQIVFRFRMLPIKSRGFQRLKGFFWVSRDCLWIPNGFFNAQRISIAFTKVFAFKGFSDDLHWIPKGVHRVSKRSQWITKTSESSSKDIRWHFKVCHWISISIHSIPNGSKLDCNWDSIQFPGLSSAFQIVPCNVKGLVDECKRISIESQMTLFEYQSNYSDCQFIMDFKGLPLSFHWFHGLSSKTQKAPSDFQ